MAEKAADILKKHDPSEKHKRNELTSDAVKHSAGKDLHDPSTLSASEIRELCGSVLAQIARHHEQTLTARPA